MGDGRSCRVVVEIPTLPSRQPVRRLRRAGDFAGCGAPDFSKRPHCQDGVESNFGTNRTSIVSVAIMNETSRPIADLDIADVIRALAAASAATVPGILGDEVRRRLLEGRERPVRSRSSRRRPS